MNRCTSLETGSALGKDSDEISLTTAVLFILFGGGAGSALVALLCLLAFGANAEDAVAMMKRCKFVAIGNLVLQLFYLFAVELDQSPTARTDQVVVMGVLVVVLVEHPAVMKLELTSETTFLKQLQRTVYGCKANRRILSLYDRI